MVFSCRVGLRSLIVVGFDLGGGEVVEFALGQPLCVHLAPSDLDEVESDRRLLFRVTLEDDVRVGPDGRASASIEGDPFPAI